MRHKLPARRNVGIDVDGRVIDAWRQRACSHELDLHQTRAEDFLATYPFEGDELVYADPPYYPTTRSRARVYRFDYDVDDHRRLLEVLAALPCMVMLSGYGNPLYDQVLASWHSTSFPSKTHAGVRTESLWFNFEPPEELHDARYFGSNFRDREGARRRLQRLQDKVHRMSSVERAAFSQWLHDAYPPHSGAKQQ